LVGIAGQLARVDVVHVPELEQDATARLARAPEPGAYGVLGDAERAGGLLGAAMVEEQEPVQVQREILHGDLQGVERAHSIVHTLVRWNHSSEGLRALSVAPSQPWGLHARP